MATTIVANPTKRPNPVTGGWLPSNRNESLIWLNDFLNGIEKNRQTHYGFQEPKVYKPSVQALKDLIEESAELSMHFKSMFDEIPYDHRIDPVGNEYKVTNYVQLLDLFNEILDKPPQFSEHMIVSLPFTLLLEWPMSTRGGIVAFLNEKLNARLGDVLSAWGDYLKDESRDSNRIIVNDPTNSISWLGSAARQVMREKDPNHADFEKVYQCDLDDKVHLGFKSWDHFFTRQFLPGVRPVEDTSDNTVTCGCESAPYAIKQKVKRKERFWIKGQPYSLQHMLDSVDDAVKFEGGTVYQAFLSPITYHRWASPINGTITKLRLIKGSYFSVSPTNTFPNPETSANVQSQAYISSVATRALIYLNNSTVGDMVMMPVGMVEVSTCSFNEKILEKFEKCPKDLTGNTWLPKPDTVVPIKKGEELGMFHFGGSSHCLIFGPNVVLKFWQRAVPLNIEESQFVPLNAVIADVSKRSDNKSIYANLD